MYQAEMTNRTRHRYDVRWNNGKTVARCDRLEDAERIARALNAASGEIVLTSDERDER